MLYYSLGIVYFSLCLRGYFFYFFFKGEQKIQTLYTYGDLFHRTWSLQVLLCPFYSGDKGNYASLNLGE